MNAAGRLGLYAAGVAAAFAGAFGIAAAVVPPSAVSAWAEGSGMEDHAGMAESTAAVESLPGLSLSAYGYVLSPVSAPAAVGEQDELGFTILDDAGEPLRDFETSHEKKLHLIVVRTDGSQYRHVHPVLDRASGTWTTPWEWSAAGTYRVYADFAPAVEGGPDKVTLTRTVDVAGELSPAPAADVKTTDYADGFEVTVDGRLIAGSASELTLTVRRDGEPVSELQPYLGAFGHLVALRDGDLAYLHVHAQGDEPKPGGTAGPEISFAAEAPTAGKYLLYFDFQVDGQVHTAEFVVDAAQSGGQKQTGSQEDSDPAQHEESGSAGH